MLFATARLAGQDALCELLGQLMEAFEKRDSNVWGRARIAQLQREIVAPGKKL